MWRPWRDLRKELGNLPLVVEPKKNHEMYNSNFNVYGTGRHRQDPGSSDPASEGPWLSRSSDSEIRAKKKDVSFCQAEDIVNSREVVRKGTQTKHGEDSGQRVRVPCGGRRRLSSYVKRQPSTSFSRENTHSKTIRDCSHQEIYRVANVENTCSKTRKNV